MDFVHVGWRLRRQFLDANRQLSIGNLFITHVKLVSRAVKLGLLGSDLDPANKQSYTGMLKIFDFCLHAESGTVTEVTKVRDEMQKDDEYYGIYLFVEFCHRYLRMFVIKGITPDQIVKDAAFCIMFIGFWRRDIKMRGRFANLTNNFLTVETARDVLISSNMAILLVKYFGIHFPNIFLDISRASSR